MALTSDFVALPESTIIGHIIEPRDVIGVVRMSDTLATALSIQGTDPAFFDHLSVIAANVAAQMRDARVAALKVVGA